MVSGGLQDFSQRVNALFERVLDPATGRPYTNVAVADALTQRGVSLNHSYLGQLRNGRKSEPSASLVGALAEFFGVAVDYFFGAVSTVPGAELARRLEVLAARSPGLDPQALVAAVQAHGEPFDEAAWEGLRSGETTTRVREAIVEAVADYFEVPHEYLAAPPGDERVELIEAQMELVDAMAGTGSEGLSLRSLGAPTPQALRAIAAALRSAQTETTETVEDS